MVLHLDFSQVGGTIDNMEKNFDEYCGAKFDYFVDYYNNVYSEDFIKKVHDAKDANMKLTPMASTAMCSRSSRATLPASS